MHYECHVSIQVGSDDRTTCHARWKVMAGLCVLGASLVIIWGAWSWFEYWFTRGSISWYPSGPRS
jgi:hypothetical protein